jgi:trans-2,3-dihydro-3-hydroxyanthranilate isomerase
MTYEYYLLDVFAEQKYAGNQLAVFTDISQIPENELQAIARETNLSETTFIDPVPVKPFTYNVRIFTVEEELPFGGHPTIGTAWIIKHKIEKSSTNFINLKLPVGEIKVTFDEVTNISWMRQNRAIFGESINPEKVAKLLNLNKEDINSSIGPCQVVSTGLPFLLAPLNNLATVRKCRINREYEQELLSQIGAKFTFVFSQETYDMKNGINARMFAESIGVPEDPATGSANGCLAAYLSKYKVLGTTSVDTVVEQGYEINRPSLLYLKCQDQEIDVGGKIILIGRGEYF